jgi:hypothetical protein
MTARSDKIKITYFVFSDGDKSSDEFSKWLEPAAQLEHPNVSFLDGRYATRVANDTHNNQFYAVQSVLLRTDVAIVFLLNVRVATLELMRLLYALYNNLPVVYATDSFSELDKLREEINWHAAAYKVNVHYMPDVLKAINIAVNNTHRTTHKTTVANGTITCGICGITQTGWQEVVNTKYVPETNEFLPGAADSYVHRDCYLYCKGLLLPDTFNAERNRILLEEKAALQKEIEVLKQKVNGRE